MTASSLNPEQPPSVPLYARQSASTPVVGPSRGSGGASGPQAGAEGFGLPDFIDVARYRHDHGHQAWAWRCWGDGDCDGWLALDKSSEESARQGATRHLTEAHQAATDQPVERMARFLAGAAHLNPQRTVAAWGSLDDADRDHYREEARRVLRQARVDGSAASTTAADYASRPGYETEPNLCRCPCYGCKHHCAAHQPPGAEPLRDRYAAALHGVVRRLNSSYDYGDELSSKTIWQEQADAVMAVRDPHLALLSGLLAEAVEWIPDGELRERICDALDPRETP